MGQVVSVALQSSGVLLPSDPYDLLTTDRYLPLLRAFRLYSVPRGVGK